MKAALSYILVLSLSLAIAIGYHNRYQSQKKTIARLEHNLIEQQTALHYYNTQKGELAAQNSVLLYTISELKKMHAREIDEIRNVHVPIRRVEQISTTVSEISKEFKTALFDTLIADSLQRAFSISDAWIHIQGVQENDSQRVSLQVIDTIVQVVYRGKRRKPYLWFFSPRVLEQVITSKNPHTRIVYNKTIKISKQ